MNWGLFICLSPIFMLAGIGIFSMLWEKYFNPYIESYRSFNSSNKHWQGSGASVKLTYKQWCDFAAIKPEAFCVEEGYLYEVNKEGPRRYYTKIHFNLKDYLKFVFMYSRLQRYRKKKAAKSKETQDMSAFIHRMQDNIHEYRKKIDAECDEAKKQLSEVAENMLKKNETSAKRTSKQLRYKGTYPPDDNVNLSVGDLYMSKDGTQMYVVDVDMNFQKWEASTLFTYITEHGLDVSEAFEFVTSRVSELEVTPKKKIRYNYLGNGLTKMIPQMKVGDIYYNPVLKKYMVMEESGEMNYLDTDDFVDRFGGINA